MSITTAELANRLSNAKGVPSGIGFIRRKVWEQKSKCRNSLIAHYGNKQFPTGMSMVTMPCIAWSFEKSLLESRETVSKIESCGIPRRTFIVGIEKNRAIYRASMLQMPGSEKGIAVLDTPDYASETIRTRPITRYHCCEFETFAYQNPLPFDCAWLDFCGSLTSRRWAAIQHFWSEKIKSRMTLTISLCRYDAAIKGLLSPDGNLETLVIDGLSPRQVVCVDYYCDSAPMLQITMDKRSQQESEITR